jgi:tRNA threonylcarbamoyl adenosine modification protein YeaZ
MIKHFALALHTTTSTLDLAIAAISYDAARQPYCYNIHQQQSWELGRDLSVRLHGCLSAFMGDILWTDLCYVAIATGVGSFTGTRIGVVVARTLGEQLDIPVYGFDCDAIVQRAHHGQPPLSLATSLLDLSFQQWRSQILHGETLTNWQQILPNYGASS